MKVKDILQQKGSQVWTVKTSDSIHEVLGMLVTHHIGALVVLDEKSEIFGIISERDIIRECYQNGKNVEKTTVSQIMTKKLIVGTLEDDIDYVMGIMTKNRIRHVPIVSAGKLQGIISIGDVVKSMLHYKEYENRYLKDYMFGSS